MAAEENILTLVGSGPKMEGNGGHSWTKQVMLISATWIISALVNYGAVTAKIEDLGRRIAYLETRTETTAQTTASRDETNARFADVQRRLERLDNKMDSYFLRGR